MCRAVRSVHLLQGGRRDRSEQPGSVYQHHGRGVFGEEHIGRGGGAFLYDLVAHLGVVAVTDGDRNPGFLGEALNPSLGQAFVLGVVHHDAGRFGGIHLPGADQCGGDKGFSEERR